MVYMRDNDGSIVVVKSPTSYKVDNGDADLLQFKEGKQGFPSIWNLDVIVTPFSSNLGDILYVFVVHLRTLYQMIDINCVHVDAYQFI